MKKNLIRAAALLLSTLMLTASLTSCRLHKVSFDAENNQYVDGSTSIRYTDAPGCYEPVAIGKEYAKIYYNRKATVTLHEMGNMDPAKWYYLAVQEATNSHEYERKENGFEKWTKLAENKDWTTFEK